MRLLQVAKSYVPLVTSINNVDTLITLIVPSVMIIFSNVRISVALSQFYRNRQLMLAQNRRVESTSVDTAAAAATQGSSSSSQSRSQRQETVLTLEPDYNQQSAFITCSFNQLQMKVQFQMWISNFCKFLLLVVCQLWVRTVL